MTENKVHYPRFLSKREFGAILVCLVIVILILAGLDVNYYNSIRSSQNSVEGATILVAREFSFSMNYVVYILGSAATPDNIDNLIEALRYQLQTAYGLLRTLRIYLVTSYESQLQTIEDLLANMTVGGYRGVCDTLFYLRYQGNITLLIESFKELSAVASQKINNIGFELREAFGFVTSNYTVETFNIIPSRMENSVNAANDLKGILNEWLTKYSPT